MSLSRALKNMLNAAIGACYSLVSVNVLDKGLMMA
jgi:hypothetical protein